jgi:flagellar basal-body rod protein FlgC
MADLLTTLEIAGSGLSAQRLRMQTVATNMANARTTRTAEGGAYQRRAPVFEAVAADPFDAVLGEALAKVEVAEVWQSDAPGRRVFEPDHPDADADGFVTYPDVNVLHEMVDLMTTGRSYEANANVVEATRDMALRALEIGR